MTTIADTQPIPIPGANPLYVAAYPSIAGHLPGYEDLLDLRDAEAVVLADLAETTAASTPWDAAHRLFGQPTT